MVVVLVQQTTDSKEAYTEQPTIKAQKMIFMEIFNVCKMKPNQTTMMSTNEVTSSWPTYNIHTQIQTQTHTYNVLYNLTK